MIYGYARCSTNENLQDIERQVRELKQQGATDETIYKEYESGTKTNRAELDKLLNIVQSGDTIIRFIFFNCKQFALYNQTIAHNNM